MTLKKNRSLLYQTCSHVLFVPCLRIHTQRNCATARGAKNYSFLCDTKKNKKSKTTSPSNNHLNVYTPPHTGLLYLQKYHPPDKHNINRTGSQAASCMNLARNLIRYYPSGAPTVKGTHQPESFGPRFLRIAKVARK